jgi:hypothetical protein
MFFFNIAESSCIILELTRHIYVALVLSQKNVNCFVLLHEKIRGKFHPMGGNASTTLVFHVIA